MKVDKNSNSLKARLFSCTKDYLYYTRNEKSKTIRGVMKIKFVKVAFFKEESEDGEERLYVRFIKNMKFCDLYARNEEEWHQWRDKLSNVMIQTDFHNKFGVIKMLGKGSFAKVYLVKDNKTNHEFAVKAFSKEFLESQDKGKLSLINEIQIMLGLDHPNVIKLYEVHESKNSIYLVLEYLQGGELFQRITESEELLTKDEIATILRSILLGLRYLAKNQILHRDLKPENLILESKDDFLSNRVKIVDFGLATFEDAEEYLFKRCGTPGFVAPEIIKANADDDVRFEPRCDIFSVGVIAYILLTGTNPFKGENFKEILRANRDCKINYEGAVFEGKDEEIVDLISRMLTRKPKNRVTAEEALQHPLFKNFLDSEDTDVPFNDTPSDLISYQQKYKFETNKPPNSPHMSVSTIASLDNRFLAGKDANPHMISSINSFSSKDGGPMSPNMSGSGKRKNSIFSNKSSSNGNNSPKRHNNKKHDFYRQVLMNTAGNKEMADAIVRRAKRESISSIESGQSSENSNGSGSNKRKSSYSESGKKGQEKGPSKFGNKG